MFGRGILSYLNQKIQYNEAKDKLEKTDSTEKFSRYGTPIYNIRPAIKRIEKSKLAPTGFGIKNNYLIVGNKYVSNLLVEKFTTHFTEGFLCEFLNDPRIKLFIIDEAHTMILKGKTAELVGQFYRRSRKYKNIMCTITQSPRDFADEKVLTHGKAIFQNAVYKIIMNLDKDGVTDVAKLDTLNDNEQLLIQD